MEWFKSVLGISSVEELAKSPPGSGFVFTNEMFQLPITTEDRVNLYFKLSEDISKEQLYDLLEKSWNESPTDTMKIIFSKGEETHQFGQCMHWLMENEHTDTIRRNFDNISRYGSFKDYWCFLDTPLEKETIEYYAQKIKSDKSSMENDLPITLAAKFAPTENRELDKKFGVVAKLATALNTNKAGYRKEYLVPIRKHLAVVERDINAKNTSVNKYLSTFSQDTSDDQQLNEFAKFLKSNSKWIELESKFLDRVGFPPGIGVVDSSDSMTGLPSDLAMTFSILLSESHSSANPFNRKVIPFVYTPSLHRISGSTIHGKLTSFSKMEWGLNINVTQLYNLILETSLEYGNSTYEVPSNIWIFTDMAIEEALKEIPDRKEIEEQFAKVGYQAPSLIFWRLNTEQVNFIPCKHATYITGIDDTLLELFLEKTNITAFDYVERRINSEIFENVKV